jgi:hypothetical protein
MSEPMAVTRVVNPNIPSQPKSLTYPQQISNPPPPATIIQPQLPATKVLDSTLPSQEESVEVSKEPVATMLPTILNSKCPECKKKAPNRECVSALCAGCCRKTDQACRAHNRKKLTDKKKKIREMIDTAIAKKQTIYIKYTAGTTPGIVRPIIAQNWDRTGLDSDFKQPFLFKAICAQSRQLKMYKLGKVEQAEWNAF